MRRLLFILVVALLGIVVGCSSNECLDNQNSLPVASFWSSDASPRQVAVDSLYVTAVGAPGDALVTDSTLTPISQLYLPFDIDKPQTSFRFEYQQKALKEAGITDVVTFHYDAEPHFASIACGAVIYYKITDITHSSNLIDSVTCPEGVITNKAGANINIYFRVTTTEQ